MIEQIVLVPRTDDVVEIPRSHAPFLSAPAELAEILAHLGSP